MKRTWLSFIFLPLAFAQPPAPDPIKAGLDPQQLTRIAPRTKSFAESGYVSGTVTLSLRKGVLSHFESSGWQDIEARRPMRTDCNFQIMSMTKPFTGVAIMMLAEEGKIRLNDPVERLLPEFRGLWMIVSGSEGVRTMRKPGRPITVRDLMAHTSGMSSTAAPGMADILIKMDRTLAEAT